MKEERGGAPKDLRFDEFVLKGYVDDVQNLGCSETDGWICRRSHYDKVTQIQYVERYGMIFSSSLDGTVKMSKLKYNRTLLGKGSFLEFDGKTKCFITRKECPWFYREQK